MDYLSPSFLGPMLTFLDISFEQAPVLITKHLTSRGPQQYLKPGFRYRIVK